MLLSICVSVINKLKTILSKLLSNPTALNEYYFVLEGHYFCEKSETTRVIIQIRRKRITFELSVRDIVSNKNFVKKLNPVDACIIGILANNERNKMHDTTYIGIKNMQRLKNNRNTCRFNPILRVTKTYINQNDQEVTILYSAVHGKEIEILSIDLIKNKAFIYALDSLQALSVGYSARESQLRTQQMG